MKYDIVIIGGGVAAMKAAICAFQVGLKCVILEKTTSLGGHVKGLHKIFPEDISADELLTRLLAELHKTDTDILFEQEVVKIDSETLTVECLSGMSFHGKTIFTAYGYKIFDATLKQEYGYGIFDNVVTSYEFEQMLKTGEIKTADGKVPEKIAFLHCVGSRDEKVMQNHCSKVCCVTAVKQAINLRQLLPQCKAYCFYMDIRMFGAGYEEMYRTAQQDYQIHFIRGKVSETAETIDKTIILKAEDTLIGKPIRVTADLIVLMIGICSHNHSMAEQAGLESSKSGFLKSINSVDLSTHSNKKGIYYIGCASAPKDITESINDAAQAVFAAQKFIKSKQ